MSTRLNRTLSK